MLREMVLDFRIVVSTVKMEGQYGTVCRYYDHKRERILLDNEYINSNFTP